MRTTPAVPPQQGAQSLPVTTGQPAVAANLAGRAQPKPSNPQAFAVPQSNAGQPTDAATGSGPTPETIRLESSTARKTTLSVSVLVGAVVASLLVGGLGGYLFGAGGAGSDVSESGKISYACEVAEKVVTDYPYREDYNWKLLGEDPIFSDLAGVAGLLGGIVALPIVEDRYNDDGELIIKSTGLPELPELGQEINDALFNQDTEALTEALYAIVDKCENR